MGVMLALMGVATARRGFGPGYAMFAIVLGITIGSVLLLALFLRGGRTDRP
jgi:hypothetical protein